MLEAHLLDMDLNVCFVLKVDIRVHSNPIASNKSVGTFVGTLKIEKT